MVTETSRLNQQDSAELCGRIGNAFSPAVPLTEAQPVVGNRNSMALPSTQNDYGQSMRKLRETAP